MAGTNKVVKENEIIFRLGDPAECMYIVRKGTLKVYFNKGAEEVQLALLKDGAIVGEMAFFDNKPRSASVKALAQTEVTEITKGDFDKLLTQVPKWVVTMMQSLSGRLRETNEKLRAIEAKYGVGGAAPAGGGGAAAVMAGQKHPFQTTLRALKFLLLALAKEGQKEGTGFSIPLDVPVKMWNDLMGEDADILNKVIAASEPFKFITKKLDSARQPVLYFSNRGSFAHFIEFFAQIAKDFTPAKPGYSEPAVALFQAMVDHANSSGYETLNVGLNEIKSIHNAKGADVSKWNEAMAELANIPNLKITKQGNDQIARVYVKEHKMVANYLKYIAAYREAKLA